MYGCARNALDLLSLRDSARCRRGTCRGVLFDREQESDRGCRRDAPSRLPNRRDRGPRCVVDPFARRCRSGDGGNAMNLTQEQMDQGRRNFLRVLAGMPAVATLGLAASVRGPVPGGPVRIGFIGVGSRGRTLLTDVDPAYADVVA